MPKFQTRRVVAFTPKQMFDLVADVESYPHFLPLCENLKVLTRDTCQTSGKTAITARMDVGYKAIRESFTSKVLLDPDNREIAISYVKGPFRHMDSRWQFRDAPRGCEINFNIDYEFKSPVLGMLIGALFDTAFRKFAESFETRAGKVYGTRASHS